MRSAATALVAMVLAAGALMWGGCRSRPADILSAAAPVAVPTAVGPIPGPPDHRSPPANPFADDRAAAGEGRRLFVRFNCSGCHGDHAGGGMGPSLRDVDWLYGNADAQLFSSIIEGRAHGMPTWASKLSPDQTWQIVAYIKSLRTSNEPQPPI